MITGFLHGQKVYTNEKEVGLGIKDGLVAAGLQRSDIYITGKCWNTHRKKEHVRMQGPK